MKLVKKEKCIIVVIIIALVFAVWGMIHIFLDRFLDIDEIYAIPQSTILVDKNGIELFRFFEEDRDWVTYDQISQPMLDAIVAVEDQSFWENSGIDLRGILRAAKSNYDAWRGGSSDVQGGSTITQQVIKNVYLTNEKTISRKIKEIILAKKLTKKWTSLFKEVDDLPPKDASLKAKEHVLEAYLNVVFYGNHAYGIDAAARQYFKTSAAELTVLQSAMLASLPQAPSLYNPTRNQTAVAGSRQFGDESVLLHGPDAGFLYPVIQEKLETYGTVGDTVESCIQSLVEGATVTYEENTYTYTHGRKDRALCRMYDQGMLTEQGVFDAFLDAENLQIYAAKFPIKAPHFVFLVQEEFMNIPAIKKSGRTFQQAIQQGFTIQTGLEYDTQIAAEDALSNYKTALKKLGGNNRAMIHIDSQTGEIRSYVGSEDFYNDEIDGQVDVLKATRQMGSTLKPFFYAYLFKHYPITKHGTIVDLPLRGNGPSNHDDLFWGKTTIENALAGSRNLPVVRLFYTLGGQEVLVPYLQSIGFKDLKNDKEYSYPLVLGADEATLSQVGQAYIQLSAPGKKYANMTTIHSIIKPSGEIYYENPGAVKDKIIPDTVADSIRSILSNKYALPQKRKRLRSLPVENIALKTGTSDIKIKGKPYPRDALSVLYTAEDVIVSRAGNTDGSAMGPKAFGGEVNHYSLRQYLQYLVDNQKIIDQPRITKTHRTIEGRYAGVDHKEFTDDQRYMMWRGIK